jgi:hypothetical protein
MFVENNLGDFMDDEIHLSLVGSHASRVFSFLDKDIKIYVEGDMGGSMKSILGASSVGVVNFIRMIMGFCSFVFVSPTKDNIKENSRFCWTCLQKGKDIMYRFNTRRV